MRVYELMYIINPNIGGDEEYTAYVDRINNLVTSNGGQIVTGDEPGPIGGRRKLAYPIRVESKDLNEGYYVLMRFEAEPARVALLERDLKLAEPILRYLLIKPEPEKAITEEE